MTLDKSQLLTTHTADVEPSVHGTAGMWFSNRRRPAFYPGIHVPEMKTNGRVKLSLSYLKGTILSLGRFWVREGDDDGETDRAPSDVKKFVVQQLTRWWRSSSAKQLQAIEYGYSASEVMFRRRGQHIVFDHLRSIPHGRAQAITVNGNIVGLAYEASGKKGSNFLAFPKVLWHVHDRESHPFYGLSRLFAAFQPWLELCSANGAMDVRQLYFYKSVYQGDVYRFPEGETAVAGTGVLKSNRDLIREAAEKSRAGGMMFLPSGTDEHGNARWGIEPRQSPMVGAEIQQYIKSLKTEIDEAIGVPSELIEAAETGSGYSGRRIPQDAFRGTLSELLYWAVADFNEQVLQPLVRLNFGIDEPDYDIVPFGLVRDEDNQTDEAQLQTFGKPGQAKVPDAKAREAANSIAV